MNEILEDLPGTITCDMNEMLSRNIRERELSIAVLSTAKGKAPGHKGVSIEFFQKL